MKGGRTNEGEEWGSGDRWYVAVTAVKQVLTPAHPRLHG